MLHSALAGLLLVVAAAIAFGAILLPKPEDKVLSGRIERTIGPQLVRAEPRRRSALPQWSDWLTRRTRQLFMLRRGSGWGVTISTSRLVLLGIGGAAGIVALCRMFVPVPWPLAAGLAAAALILLPRLIASRQQRRSLDAFGELFPDTMDMIVRMIRAGLPIGAAVKAVGDLDMLPVSEVFRQVADQTTIGVPLEEALAGAAAQVGAPDFRFFAVAVALQRSTGGNLAVTLETLAEILRKRRAMRLKAKATTAEVRLSTYVLGGIPFLVTTGLTVLAPNYIEPLINDPTGNIIGISAIVSLLMAFATMRWLTRRNAV